MSDTRITPDEFARLMALQEADPERRRAEARAEFAAMKALLETFEAHDEPGAGAAGMESIRAELARRVVPRVAGATGAEAEPGGTAPARDRARPRAAVPPGALAALIAVLTRPASRWGVAFAAIALIAGVGWWSSARRAGDDVLRGERPAGAFEVHARARATTLELDWPAAPGAGGYRVVFLGPDLAEVARLDLGRETTITLGRGSLPEGLASGAAVSIEIEALAEGAVIATTPARAIRLP